MKLLALLGAGALAAGTMIAAVPADAQHYGHGYHRGHDYHGGYGYGHRPYGGGYRYRHYGPRWHGGYRPHYRHYR